MFNFFTFNSEIVCFIFYVGIFLSNLRIGIFMLKAPAIAEEYCFDVSILIILAGVKVGSN
jgi:hypothetical protein